MKKINEKEYYEEIKDWDFSKFEIESESLTKWDLYELLNKLANKEAKILDLGTGGGEKVLKYFPKVKEILATDYSEGMIETAKKNLAASGRKDVTFRLMDNLKMDVPEHYFDIVVARNTVTDPKQIYKCLKKGGYLLISGVDKYDCWNLKLLFGKGQGFYDKRPISIVDYENVLKAGFNDVELIPIHEREYFKNKELFIEFLKKVPIIDDFSEEIDDNKDYYSDDLDENILDEYIKDNTYNGKIRLLRRYYGITAKK
ncbi:MAG: methyltransferase domain-containing protein [Bacilli bacterium]|nr:methyltransferase domain-containing protein [Bacilli bacterium]